MTAGRSIRRGKLPAFARAAILWGLSLAACSSPSRLPAVPDALRDQAEVVGLPGVRLLGDPSLFVKDAVDGAERERVALAALGYKGPLPPAAFLALSGGGDNGAFGAGLLVGWTAAGTRPEFKLVSGISTGALIAPFAFLGPKYDAQLKAIYTGISDKGIMTKRSPTRRAVRRRHGGQRAPLAVDQTVRDRRDVARHCG